jgi:hypothetical protein
MNRVISPRSHVAAVAPACFSQGKLAWIKQPASDPEDLQLRTGKKKKIDAQGKKKYTYRQLGKETSDPLRLFLEELLEKRIASFFCINGESF